MPAKLSSAKLSPAKLSKTHNLAWRKFLVTHVRLVEQIEQDLAEAGLPPLGWYDVLFALSEAPDRKLRLHELAQTVLLSRSNVTRLLDRLEAAGLIQRQPCPDDRRGAYAVITDAGLATLEQIWTLYSRAIATYFACHLDNSEVKVLIRILNRIITGLDG